METVTRRLGRWGTAGVVFAIVSFVFATAARADEEPEALIRQGVEMRKAGDDVRAHGYFKRAYSIAHTARSAAQLGLVELALKYFVDAEIHLTESLETPDAWVDSNRAVLEKSRTKARSNLGQALCSDCPPGTTIEAPGRLATRVPPQGGVWLAPGSLVLKFSAPGRSSTEKAVIVVAGKDVRVSSGLALPIRIGSVSGQPSPVGEVAVKASTSSASSPATPSPMRGDDKELASAASANSIPRLVGIIATGVGVVAVGTGVLVYRSGRNKHDAIASDAANDRHYNPANSNYQTLANVGTAIMIIGSAAIVTGAVLYIFNRDDDVERGTTGRVDVSLAPALTSAVGGIVQIGGTF